MKKSLKNYQFKVWSMLLLTHQNLYAECADRYVRCRDNKTDVKVNYKYNVRAVRCMPMLTGGGHSLDVAIAECENGHGGLDTSLVPQGYGWTDAIDAGAKLGQNVYGLYQESQKGNSSTTPTNFAAPSTSNVKPPQSVTPPQQEVKPPQDSKSGQPPAAAPVIDESEQAALIEIQKNNKDFADLGEQLKNLDMSFED